MPVTTQEICTPPGLLPDEQREYWRGLAQELYAACKAMMPEGWDAEDHMDHMPGIKLARLAIAKAEGRS